MCQLFRFWDRKATIYLNEKSLKIVFSIFVIAYLCSLQLKILKTLLRAKTYSVTTNVGLLNIFIHHE